MGSSRACVLVMLLLLGSVVRTAKGQTAPSLDELCRLPPPAAGRAGMKAEREAQLRQAAMAFDLDQYAESLIALRAAYAADPSADIVFNMGQACLAAGRIEEGFALYTRAQSESTSAATTATITNRLAQLRPRLAKALTLKAILLGSQKKDSEACAVWSRAYELDPRPLYLLQLADALGHAGRTEEALALYERLINLPQADEIAAVARQRIADLREPVEAPAASSAAAPPQPRAPLLEGTVPVTAEGPLTEKNRVPIYRKWWFWTALIAATTAVGLGVGLGTKAALDRPSYPDLRQISF